MYHGQQLISKAYWRSRVVITCSVGANGQMNDDNGAETF